MFYVAHEKDSFWIVLNAWRLHLERLNAKLLTEGKCNKKWKGVATSRPHVGSRAVWHVIRLAAS